MILVSSPSKPFEYNNKGTPRRKVALRAYEDEIEQVYASLEISSQADIPVPSIWSPADCVVFIRRAVMKAMKYTVRDDEDIFQAGCDRYVCILHQVTSVLIYRSFRARWIRNIIIDGLRQSVKLHIRRKIPQNLVYFNPTINKLTLYLTQMIHHGQASVALSMTSGRIAEMEGLVRKYCATFPSHHPRAHQGPPIRGDIVLLTGSTGFLGSHILKDLVEAPKITRVYALNRRDREGKRSVKARHISGFRDRGLDVSILSSDKIVFLEGDTASEYLGLGPDMYHQLQSAVTHIIHNGSVQINPFRSFGSHQPFV